MSKPRMVFLRGKKAFVEELNREVTTVKQKTYFITDTSKDFHTSYGVLKKTDLAKKDGSIIKSSFGKAYTIFTAQFIDLFKHFTKLPQTIPLKDIGLIIAETSINKESIVVEAGTGSGALTAALANIAKQVYSYDIREDCQKIARKNLESAQLKNITLKLKDITKGIDEKNVDLVCLDIPDPWNAIHAVTKSLTIGGYLVSYSPSITQVQDFVNELLKNDSYMIQKTSEVIERVWEVEGRKVRPKTTPIGHSGFLTFARKIA